MYHEIIEVLWFILPAYVANSMAINVSGIPVLKKFSTPIDLGLTWRGRRLLGDGKTWRGLMGGVLSGTFVGFIQMIYQPSTFPTMSVTLAFLLSFGAMFGDLSASFLKRRAGLERGMALPLIDQLDYVVGAFFFAWLIVPVDFQVFFVAIVITIPLHIIANIFAWSIKLKKVPW